ncbi:MAG: DNA modification methylase [Planctomyces sp.]|nr:DNA modification methylase [Planctomyces sp.]
MGNRSSKTQPVAEGTFRDRIREFRKIKAADLVVNELNWRVHPENQKSAMRAVLSEIGWVDAIMVRERGDGKFQIVDGHLRASMAPDDEVPVLVIDVTEEEANKILVTFDPIAAMAESNATNLDTLLREVDFSDPALKQLLEELSAAAALDESATPMEVVEDDIPAPPDQATTNPGDLWVLGNHRLLCGDSSKADDFDRLLNGHPIHLVNTDPPYNVKVEPRSNNAHASGTNGLRNLQQKQKTTDVLRAKDRPLANDFVSDEEFDRLVDAWFSNISRVLQPGRAFYIWGGGYPGSGGAKGNHETYPQFMRKHELKYAQLIIWDKQHPVLTRKDFMGAHESCFYGWREGAAHQYYGPPNATDLWHVKKVNPQSMVHLTEKPVELAARSIQYSSVRGENVLDLFGGSGSTLIAAEQTGRNSFLMELDPLYCDVIVQRWENLTGRKAYLETS